MFTLEGKTVDFWIAEFDGISLKVTVTPTIIE